MTADFLLVSGSKCCLISHVFSARNVAISDFRPSVCFSARTIFASALTNRSMSEAPMRRAQKDIDEDRVAHIARRLLAMPHNPREESKLGKATARTKRSPKRRK